MEAKLSSCFILLLVLSGNLRLSCAQAGDYYDLPAKGDLDGGFNEPVGNANRGFDDVVRRHDGYVKGETPTIPKTSFSCSVQPYNPGLYADMEANCQVYHVCFEDRQESFLCGPGTNFNQRILACDFWYNFNCQDSATFYGANSEIGKVPDTVYRPDGSRNQPEQRPDDTYQPPRIPQPPRGDPIRPQPPRIPQPPRGDPIQPQPPRIPQPPRGDPVHPPRIPQPPRRDPIQPPRIPQPPRGDPIHPPRIPQPPRGDQIQPPRIPQPPRGGPIRPPPRIPQPPRGDPIRPQPPRIPQPSGQPPSIRPPAPYPSPPPFQQEVDDGYEPQRPHVTNRPVFPPVISPPRVSRPQPPIIRRPAEPSRPHVITRPRPVDIPQHPDYEFKGSDYRPPRPEQPRIPQPSQPVDVGYPTYSPRPVPEPPSRPVARPSPPPVLQQEHVDVDYTPPSRQPPPPSRPSYVPPPPPPPPSRPSYVPRQPPPPPPPVQQEAVQPDFVRPPAHSRPSASIVPPQPPSAPSVSTQQRRPPPTPVRPPVSVPTRPRPPPPQRQRPVFPPAIDHPNANVKGGPGYRQPPPAQLPSYEPTRINHRPSGSSLSTGIQKPVHQPDYRPPVVRPPPVRQPSASVSTPGIKRPPAPSQSVETRYKPPRTPPALPPPPPPVVVDHPGTSIKGYREPPPPQRVVAPATSITAVKRPQCNRANGYGCPRPQPPSAPSTRVKTKRPSADNQVYQPEPEPAPGRIKLPSQSTGQIARPAPIDHPDASIKGGPRLRPTRPQVQPIRVPSLPSVSHQDRFPGDYTSDDSYQQTSHQRPNYPRGDGGQEQQEVIIHEQPYEPQRRPSTITQHRDTSGHVNPNKRLPSSSQSVHDKPDSHEYDTGSSYTRGPESYPKPEFQQQGRPVSTPSRSSQIAKQTSASQNRIPQRQRPSAPSGSYPAPSSPRQSGLRPQNEYGGVPGHQPANRPQLFPHRDNPDHPNESIKGTSAYRPPPPANFQASASETQQQVVEQPETQELEQSSKLGDNGSE